MENIRLKTRGKYVISDIAGVHITCFEEGGHGVVKMLRDRGELEKILSGEM